MSEGLVTVREFGDNLQAELFQMRLEQEGIKAVIVGDILTTGIPFDGEHVEVQVAEEDEEKAKGILEVYLAECEANAGDEIGDDDAATDGDGGDAEGGQ